MITRALPRKLVELGRIRLGDRQPNSNGKGDHPHKLTEWRITSKNKPLLEYASQQPSIGGTVREWTEAPGEGRQWELYTTTNTLDVVIPTFAAITLSYERWSTAGCEQRCTGEFLTHYGRKPELIGQECICPADDQERAKQAAQGKACARILRLNVLLPDLPGTGFFRMETKGFFATVELMGTLALLKEAGAEHLMIEGSLVLEQRMTKKVGEGGGTLHYAVPVLVTRYTFRQIAAAKDAHQALLMAAPAADDLTPALIAEKATKAMADLGYDAPGPATASTPTKALPQARTSQPAGEAGANLVVQIEALILAAKGNLESWWSWAERQRTKARTAFSTEDLTWLLERLRAEAGKKRGKAAKEKAGEHTATVDENTTSPSQAQNTTTQSAEPTTGTLDASNTGSLQQDASQETPEEDWREVLTILLTRLKDMTLTQEAIILAEDATAFAIDGELMLDRVRQALAAQDAEDEDLPF